MRTNRRGLTLVESVVILALIAVFVMLLAPAMQAAQLFARRAQCTNNLKQLGLALHNYHAAIGVFPMSRVEGPKGHGVGHSNSLLVLPYMEYAPVYNAYNFWLEPWHLANSTVTRTRINTLLCPDNSKTVASRKAEDIPTFDDKKVPGSNEFWPVHYGANWGGGHKGYGDDFVKDKGTYRGVMMTVLTPEGRQKRARNVSIRDIIDGTALTVAMVEKLDGASWTIGGWANSEFDVNETPSYSGDDNLKKMVFTGSVHPTGPNVLMTDGSVHPLSPTIEKSVWYALMTRDGVEDIKFDQFRK